MNFVGHHEVARRSGLDDAGRLGAMLPDFASMLGVRLRREVLPARVETGVAAHHVADAAFHSHEMVQAAMHALTATLVARGVARGPARAVGHVGYEMVLDSTVDPAGVIEALGHADDPGVAESLGDHPEWRPMCRHLAQRAARYDDPVWVADRLFHILGRRPRLSFPIAQTATVAEALADAAPAIHGSAVAIFDDVTTAVSPASRATHATPSFW
jgi:hypothetical protein